MKRSSSSGLVLRVPMNLKGRDFFLPDVHGAYNLVWRAMKAANFDPAVDRIFSLGDLIDRGPESHRVVAFLRQPYVHAIRGNHEQILIDLYAQGEPAEGLLRWAASRFHSEWWLEASPELRLETLNAIRQLPVAIEIPTARGTVGLVHADVPAGMDWPTFLAKIEEGDEQVLATALEGRRRIRSGNAEGVAGVGRVFVGHTPQWEGLRSYGNVYAVDTGAIFAQIPDLSDKPGARITFGNIAMDTKLLIAPVEAKPVDVRDGSVPTERPFGADEVEKPDYQFVWL